MHFALPMRRCNWSCCSNWLMLVSHEESVLMLGSPLVEGKLLFGLAGLWALSGCRAQTAASTLGPEGFLTFLQGLWVSCSAPESCRGSVQPLGMAMGAQARVCFSVCQAERGELPQTLGLSCQNAPLPLQY